MSAARCSPRLPDLLDERDVADAFGLPNERAARRFLRAHGLPVAKLGRRFYVTRRALLNAVERMARAPDDVAGRVGQVVANLATRKRQLSAVLSDRPAET